MNESKSKIKTLFIIDAILINVAYLLTTGVVLSGYLVYLGATDFLVAILNNSMNFSSVICLLSYLIFERRARRKKLLLSMNIASRTLIFLIILLPLLFPQPDTSSNMNLLLTILIISSNILFCIYRVGWTVWIMNTIPDEGKTTFFYRRMFMIRLTNALTLLGSGFFIDFTGRSYIGFLIIFILSYVLSLLDIYILQHTEEKPYANSTLKDSSLSRCFFNPVSHSLYRHYLIFIISFYLFTTMSSSFTTVYLIRYIKLDMGTISLINVVTTGVILLTNRFWSNIESSRGYTFVVGRTTLLLAGELLVLSFVNGNFLTLPLLFISAIIAGAGNGGFIIAVLTYRYEIMPSDNKTLHEGWYYFAFGIGTLGGPFAGKLLMNFIPVVKNIIYQYSNFQLLYLLSAVILMLLAYVSFFRPGCTARE